jgi:hypothetical protein
LLKQLAGILFKCLYWVRKKLPSPFLGRHWQ